MHVCFNHEKNTMPGTESMYELMLNIINIKLEANEELNGLNIEIDVMSRNPNID